MNGQSIWPVLSHVGKGFSPEQELALIHHLNMEERTVLHLVLPFKRKNVN